VVSPTHAGATLSAGPLPSLPVEFETPGVAPGTPWIGITWSKGSSVPARSIDKIVRWRNGFVGVLVDARPGNHLYASSDGEFWHSLGDQLPAAYWRVVESPAGLLALEFDPAAPPVELAWRASAANRTPVSPRGAWASADGVHWRKLGPISGLDDASVLGLAGSRTSIVAVTCQAGVGSPCLTWTSSDGTRWHRTELATDYRPASLTFGAGRFLLTASGIWNSLDGTSWSYSIPDSDSSDYFVDLTRIEVGSGGLLAFPPSRSSLFRSHDGINWQFSSDFPGNETRQQEDFPLCPAAYAVSDGYRFFAYTEDAGVATSLDGVTWSWPRYLPQPDGLDRWDVTDSSGCNLARPLRLLPRGVLAGGHDAAAYGASG
jgi:hypothetical protein